MKDDLIKRSDAIGAITNHCENECYYRVDNWCPQCQREEFEEAIKAVPSADRPQGEWVSDYSSPVAYRCTACNTLQHWSVIQNGRYRFCPNCGARMKGAKDDAI